ncbi:unnamed protein product [Meloidogyne enterolobii]|uniref:Uncharacterized protein n=1 Tax=Meloidogyne enterolobii TaxID=390850 RepID=A0ACB1AV84_MELEN
MFNTIVLFPLINFLVIFTHFSIAEQDDIQPNNAPSSLRDLRRAPQRTEEPKCGTADLSYQPCTSKTVANKLFLACCEQFVAPECHFLCQYETDHAAAKKLILQSLNSRCGLKSLSGVLYCASQNRNNQQCCQDLDLNSPQLLVPYLKVQKIYLKKVGSRCLRMCDPGGSQLGRLTKDDATCLYNWNVIMYCHHSGIREM